MAGSPFPLKSDRYRPAIQFPVGQELSGLAAKTYAYFSTETYRLDRQNG
jgi:hypothetical protein